MSIKLNQFIKNLNEFNKNPMAKLKKEIIYIVYATLWQMAKYQIVDTGHARSLIIGKFASKYGFTYEDLDTYFWDYWGNFEEDGRDWWSHIDKTTMKETENKLKYTLDLIIKDDGIYQQELGTNDRYPSEKHAKMTGRNNSEYKRRHLTMVADMVNSNNFGSLEKFNYDAYINEICKLIDKELIK